MNSIKTALSLIALSAIVAPELSMAMNPTRNYAQIGQLLNAGQNDQALKLCTDTIKFLENPKSRLGAQFKYLLPFFYWELARVQEARGDYKSAEAAYDKLVSTKAFRDKKMIEAAKNNPGKALDYTPFFTMSMFKRGYNTYRLAAGNDKKKGDPSLYPKAIEQLEKYYEMLRAGRVSPAEKKLKLDSQICLLLLQSAILQKEPNFEQATKYLEAMRKSRSRVPDDMIIGALNTIADVAKTKPEYIAWMDKIITAAPENFDFGVLRGGRYASIYLKQGADAAGKVNELVKAGKHEEAIGAARSALALFSLLPDTQLALDELGEQTKYLARTTSKSIPDAAWSASYIPAHQTKVHEMFQGFQRDNMTLESMTLLVNAQIANSFQSRRLSKASFKVVTDKYPNYSTRDKGKIVSYNDKNLLQLMSLHNQLGETSEGSAIEKILSNSSSGGITKDDETAIALGRAQRQLKEGDYEGTIATAEELERAFADKKDDINYTNALFFRLSALFKLQRYDDIVKYGEPFLAAEFSGGKLDAIYETAALFYVMDAYNKLGAADSKHYDRAIELAGDYIKKYPSFDLAQHGGMAAFVYFNAIDSYAKRAGYKEGEERAKDLEKAYEHAQVITKHWPEHSLAPIAALLSGNILINGEDEKRKAEGIKLLETAAKSGLALGTPAGKGFASNAYYWLASYAHEIPMPKEKPEDAPKRIQGYIDSFWEKADQPGDPYALVMGYLSFKKATQGGDDAAITAASDRMKKLIAREAAQSKKAGKTNTDLQNTFPSYVELYFETMKAKGKPLSYEQQLAFHRDFPGIAADDKAMRAIIDISAIGLMQAQLDGISADDTAALSAQQEEISKSFREMLREYKPADLSPYGSVEMGNYLVNYVRALPESRQSDRASAVGYFDRAINGEDPSMRAAAMLGKANALALATDAKVREGAKALYEQVVAMQDSEISPGALVGLARVQMAQGDYEAAINSGKEYAQSAVNNDERADMLMLLGEAYAKAGHDQNAIITYMNLSIQGRSRVSYSAPATVAQMGILWKRNNPSSGDRMKGNYKPSDRWVAWKAGQDYVSWVEKTGIESKMTPADRDKYREVARITGEYGSESSVQNEDRATKEFERSINSSK